MVTFIFASELEWRKCTREMKKQRHHEHALAVLIIIAMQWWWCFWRFVVFAALNSHTMVPERRAQWRCATDATSKKRCAMYNILPRIFIIWRKFTADAKQSEYTQVNGMFNDWIKDENKKVRMRWDETEVQMEAWSISLHTSEVRKWALTQMTLIYCDISHTFPNIQQDKFTFKCQNQYECARHKHIGLDYCRWCSDPGPSGW